MSAIVGIFPGAESEPAAALLQRAMGTMASRGAEAADLWTGPGAALAVSRFEWECESELAGPAAVARDGGVLCVTDAALYYREDLRAALARHGVTPRAETVADLVIAAYRAWGARCAERLEGEFAFILWDADERRLVFARDYSGRRPLYHASVGGTLMIASTATALAALHPSLGEIDPGALAACASGLLGASPASCYRGVLRLPHATTFVREGVSGAGHLGPNWEPPVFEQGGGANFEDAAVELREVLGRAVVERMPAGPATVWMSGGWDSTAVYSTGRAALRERGRDEDLRVVSISYPKGDPGREDEIIELIAAHWKTAVHWLHADRMPFFQNMIRGAATRDEPAEHVFETWNRALIAGARAVGTRVAFDGFGGDGLFQVSYTFLADLLRRGRLLSLYREARHAGLGPAALRTYAVEPLLPAPLRGRLRGGAGSNVLAMFRRQLPSWVTPAARRRFDLDTLAETAVPRRRRESLAALETQWHFRSPWIPYLLSRNSAFGLEGGVEIRSPLNDRRVIELAARRPRWERHSLGETKQLLRHAMRGLMPPATLSPRTHRTGMTSGYLQRSLAEGLPPLVQELERECALADYGIIDVGRLRDAASSYAAGRSPGLGAALCFTLHAEHWLRARRLPAHSGAAEGSTRAPSWRTGTIARAVEAGPEPSEAH